MSLIESMMDECIIMNKIQVSDGQGGKETIWEDGAEIKAAIIHDSSIEAKIAESEGVTSVYTITTTKENELDFHDVLKRKRDGSIFRVTSNSGDIVSPNVSSLNIAQVSAERWVLTS